MAQINSLKALNRESPDVSKSDLFSIAPHLLLEEENFNTRDAFCPDYYERPEIVEGIRSLADAYTRSVYVPPIVVQVRDGKVFVRDGHRRRRGLLLAIENGADIRKVQVLEYKGDEAEQTLLIASTNEGLPLSPIARAVIYSRLAGWGWTDQEIAKSLGRTTEHVRQTRYLMELPIELKKMIQQEVIAATFAAELYREHGDKVFEVISEAQKGGQQQANAEPKKLTKKSVEKVKAPKIHKKVVEEMHRSFTTISKSLDSIKSEGDTFTLTLSRDEVESLQALREKLAQFEAAQDEFNEAQQTLAFEEVTEAQ